MYKQIPNWDKCLLTLEKLIECNNALNKGAEYIFVTKMKHLGSGPKLRINIRHQDQVLPQNHHLITYQDHQLSICLL